MTQHWDLPLYRSVELLCPTKQRNAHARYLSSEGMSVQPADLEDVQVEHEGLIAALPANGALVQLLLAHALRQLQQLRRGQPTRLHAWTGAPRGWFLLHLTE